MELTKSTDNSVFSEAVMTSSEPEKLCSFVIEGLSRSAKTFVPLSVKSGDWKSRVAEILTEDKFDKSFVCPMISVSEKFVLEPEIYSVTLILSSQNAVHNVISKNRLIKGDFLKYFVILLKRFSS